jgi:hypothetical protein
MVDRRIQTARTYARVQYVPQRKPMIAQGLQSLCIGEPKVGTAKRHHDPPELVAGTRAVLAGIERGDAWHTAQDQDAWGGSDDGREAVDPTYWL